MSKHPKSKLSLPTKDEVRHQLERMLASADISITPQQTALLRYVVDQTLAGKADRIKGYTIATEVFGRRSDFDQNIDPIVSIQAARLRRALADYYQGAGKYDPLRIDIPKGAYVPEFRPRQNRPAKPAAPSGNSTPTVKIRWPSVIVMPLQNLSNDPEFDFLGIGLSMEIAHELNRYPDIRVLTLKTTEPDTMAEKRGVLFKLDGSVRRDNTCIKTVIQLSDIQTRRLVWSETHRFPTTTAKIISFQEGIARNIAQRIAGQHGHVARTVDSRLDRLVPEEMPVYEAVLRYYEYDLKQNAATFAAALKSLERAVVIDPECGQAWSMLGRLFADIFALEIPGFEDPLEKALAFGQKATRMLPDDQRSRTVMAYIHLLRSDLAAGLAEAEEAFRMGPKTLFIMDSIGYLMTLLGEWERGPVLIEEVISLNPFYSNHVHYALWVDYLRRADYEGAHLEAMKLNRPRLFWDHLAKAATFGLCGHVGEGRRSAAKLLDLKPDFAERGRTLIGHFIKFDDIAERVIAGLDAVGIKVR